MESRNEALYKEAVERFGRFLSILDQCMLSDDMERLLVQTKKEILFLKNLKEEVEFDNSRDILHDFEKYKKPRFTRL